MLFSLFTITRFLFYFILFYLLSATPLACTSKNYIH